MHFSRHESPNTRRITIFLTTTVPYVQCAWSHRRFSEFRLAFLDRTRITRESVYRSARIDLSRLGRLCSRCVQVMSQAANRSIVSYHSFDLPDDEEQTRRIRKIANRSPRGDQIRPAATTRTTRVERLIPFESDFEREGGRRIFRFDRSLSRLSRRP